MIHLSNLVKFRVFMTQKKYERFVPNFIKSTDKSLNEIEIKSIKSECKSESESESENEIKTK